MEYEMIKTIIRITAVLLLYLNMPFSVSAAGSKQVEAYKKDSTVNNGVLIFVGSAHKHFRLDDSINAALHDAARKVAFFHSVTAETASHESGGVLTGNSFISAFEIKEPDDSDRYIEKLEYNRNTDVFETDDAVFVYAAYRSNTSININYKPVQNGRKPHWVDNTPSKIGSYLAGVGFSTPLLYHSDTIKASYENAILSLIETSCANVRIIESETKNSNNFSSLSVTAGTLTGFYVLDTWLDPVNKSVWTLAIAKDFTENRIISENSKFNNMNNLSPSYQIIPVQAFTDTLPSNWTTILPKDTNFSIYFWGFSGKSKDRREAETKALQDAKIRISGYIYETVEGNYNETLHYQTDRGYIVENSEIIDEFYRSYTKNILEGVKPERSQPVTNSDGSIEVQILVSINKTDIEKKRNEIYQQMADLSRYYSSQITDKDAPGLETLRKYEQIASRLDPLQRSLVNYLGLTEPVNLYVYLTEQIRKLGGIVYAAHVEFRGNFSSFERNNILNALQDGLRSNNVFLQLHSAPTNTGFIFIISGEEEINYSLFRWKIPGLSVQFMQGNSLLKSDYIQVVPSQLNRDWLIDATVKEIKQKNDFFRKIKDVLEKG
jgi:hypothetical protein